MEVEIGKFTLESLTTGMYSDAETCYREYIQNAVDSLDTALAEGIMQAEEIRVEIIVDEERQEISIRDNGTGINKDLASKTLLDIGNSTKVHTLNRGFRGIGRLGGLSYCRKLSFCTTAINENVKTLISFDCEKLRELLIPGQGAEHNLQSLIEAVTDINIMDEQASAHYFIVKMEGVDDISTLLDIELVKDYISQVAPIPFKSKFYWGREIKKELEKHNIKVDEYPIFVGDSFESLSQMYKPYKNRVKANSRAGEATDEIQNLSFYEINDDNQQLIACGWYANTDFSGTLVDERISGIRVRQGNILIGNQRTLASCFKESRFNAWVIGEVYAITPNLLANARRDDFEKNATFTDFTIGLKETIGTEITNKIRAASKTRNNPIQKTIRNVERDISKVEDVLATGFHSSVEKEQVAKNLEATKRNLYSIPKDVPPEVAEKKDEMMQRLSTLSEEVGESTNYRVKKDIPSNFSKAEKKVAQAWLEVLTRNFERETVNSLYNEFLEELQSGGHKS